MPLFFGPLSLITPLRTQILVLQQFPWIFFYDMPNPPVVAQHNLEVFFHLKMTIQIRRFNLTHSWALTQNNALKLIDIDIVLY